MYSEIAEKMRRCTGYKKNGAPCKAWALWTSGDQKCKRHTVDAFAKATNSAQLRKICRCAAYAWPHRPGGGLCQWPDVPAEVCTIPASTHKRKPPKPRKPQKGKRGRHFSYVAGRDPIEKLYALMEYWPDDT